MIPPPPRATRMATRFPDTTLFRSAVGHDAIEASCAAGDQGARGCVPTHRVVFDKALWKLALQTRFVHGGCAQDQGILALMAKLDDHQPRFTEHGAVIEQPQIGRASCRERVCQYV